MARLYPRGLTALTALLALAACEVNKSANPTAPSVAGPIPGVAITQPNLLDPGNGSTVTFTGEPPTLLMETPGTNSARTLYMQVEVSTDGNFSQLVHHADQVSPGPNGRTSYRLPQPLGAGFTYFWRSRGADGANTGPYSAVSSFSVVPPVVIDPPTPASPSGTLSNNRPEFRVTNGTISGTTGVVYRFEVSTAPDFSSLLALVTVTPGSNGTTTMSLGELPYSTTFYWRAHGTDGTTRSNNSATMTFRTSAPPPPPTAPAPTSPNAPAASGPVGGPRTISPSEAMSIIRGVHDAERWDLGGGSSREQRIAFIQRAAAVVHYGHGRFNPRGPDSNWCIKDAGQGRPISDDVIVRCNNREAYDLIVGAGGNGYSWHVDYIGILPTVQNVFPPSRSALP